MSIRSTVGSTPTAALVSSGSSSTNGIQRITLAARRLVVGICLHDTLAHFPETGLVYKYKLRPYLRYFGGMLDKMKCDVTLFSHADPSDEVNLFNKLRHEFRCPGARFRFTGAGRDGTKFHYQNAMSEMAQRAGSDDDRVLFIDCRAHHYANMSQTVVVEKFAPAKRLRGSERAKLSAKAEDKQVALTVDDYTLIALAEMVKEMSSSEVSVSTYLKTEPLLESIRVPLYGDVYALPMENCDHMEKWDLDRLHVAVCGTTRDEEEMTRKKQSGPDVVETPEHEAMFH